VHLQRAILLVQAHSISISISSSISFSLLPSFIVCLSKGEFPLGVPPSLFPSFPQRENTRKLRRRRRRKGKEEEEEKETEQESVGKNDFAPAYAVRPSTTENSLKATIDNV
jgi:hypothetical protein